MDEKQLLRHECRPFTEVNRPLSCGSAVLQKSELLYEDLHDSKAESEVVFSFTSPLDYPDHIAQRHVKAPERTKFDTRIVPFPEKFEELLKTPDFNPHRGEIPVTGCGFLSIESDTFEENEEG